MHREQRQQEVFKIINVTLVLVYIAFVCLIISFTCLVFSILDSVDRKDDSAHIHVAIVCFLLFVFIIGFCVYGQIRCEKSEWEYSDIPYLTENIESLNDSNMIQGRFFIRSGYINEDMYYQYMVKNSDGGFVYNKVNANSSTIFYDSSTCRVEWHRRQKNWLFFGKEETYQNIYIPEGSISNDYSVDLN